MKQLHFNRKQLLRPIYLASMVAALMTGSAHAQITLDNFESYTVGNTPTTAPGGYTWNVTADTANGDSATVQTDTGINGTQYLLVNNEPSGGHTINATLAFDSAQLTTASTAGGTGAFSIDVQAPYTQYSFNYLTVGNGSDAFGIEFFAYFDPQILIQTLGDGSVASAQTGGNFTGATTVGIGFNTGDWYHVSFSNIALSDSVIGANTTALLTITDLTTGGNSILSQQINGVGSSAFSNINQFSVGEIGINRIIGVDNIEISAAAVPEPSNYAMLILGGALLLALRMNQKKTTLG